AVEASLHSDPFGARSNEAGKRTCDAVHLASNGRARSLRGGVALASPRRARRAPPPGAPRPRARRVGGVARMLRGWLGGARVGRRGRLGRPLLPRLLLVRRAADRGPA